jgi:hypothetical protein
LPTLAYIRWFDSAIYHGPVDVDELNGFSEMESAGFLIEDTPDHVTLALDRNANGTLRLVLCIPRANIRTLRKVKVKGGD